MTDNATEPDSARPGAAPGARRTKATGTDPLSGGVGQALRSAFQRTTEEAVPADLLDLLNKLR